MPTIEQLTTPLRHESDPARIAGQLQAMHNVALDIVAPQSAVQFSGDEQALRLCLPEPIMTEHGVLTDSVLRHTRTAWSQLAGRLSIPIRFLDRIGTDHPLLCEETVGTLAAEDESRRMMLRLWEADDGLLLRAMVSDSFAGAIDNFTVFASIVEGVQNAGVLPADIEISADLTPDRFRVRIGIPQIAIMVPELLGDYRMPFSMREDRPTHARPDAGEQPPVIFAGMEAANSDTGQGALTFTPRGVVGVCRNGLVREALQVRRTHAGSRQENDGIVQWSAETNRAYRELVASQTADAVRTFCSTEFLDSLVAEMVAAKDRPVEDPQAAVQVVQQRAELTDSEVGDLLACFTRSGDLTALGMGQALTAAAQLSEDGDRQAELEAQFWNVIAEPALA